MGDIMVSQSNLSKSECFDIIKYIINLIKAKKTESAVAEIVDYLRASFGVSCVCVRETLLRPYSLRFTYESIDTEVYGKPRYINQTSTFEEEVWKSALAKFSDGCYQYNAGGEQTEPLLFVSSPPKIPKCMIQLPMYTENDFFGILELLNFDEIRDWNDCEISTLEICASLICQTLYRLNSSFIALHSKNVYDPLTGLMNFRVFTEKLDEKLSELLTDSPVYVVYTDIHHFKYINETYGYKKVTSFSSW